MNFELMFYYLKQAKWCIIHSSEPIIATLAYLKCFEDEFDRYVNYKSKSVPETGFASVRK